MEFGTARIPQRSIFLPYWFGSSELWFVQTIEICLVVWNIWITVFFSIWTSSKFHQQKRRQMIQDGDPTPTICWTFSWDFLDWNIWIIFHILGIIIPTDFIFSLGIAASFLSKKKARDEARTSTCASRCQKKTGRKSPSEKWSATKCET